MRTPKESFLTSGHSAAFSKVVSTECFEVACNYALLELSYWLPPTTTPGIPTDPYIAIDANSQLFGAKKVIAILQSLSDPIKTETSTKKDTLNYGS